VGDSSAIPDVISESQNKVLEMRKEQGGNGVLSVLKVLNDQTIGTVGASVHKGGAPFMTL